MCHQVVTIPTRQWKLHHDAVDFLCSKECVLGFIREGRETIYKGTYSGGLMKVPVEGPVYNGIRYRSNYEVSVAKFFDDNNINFMYEPYTFKVSDDFYTPDFYVSEFDCFVEVKGLFGLGSKSKISKFLTLYPGINYVFIPNTLRNDFNRKRKNRRS